MADIAGLVAGLAICPDVVTQVADMQMLNRVIANLVGIPSADRRAGNNPLWIAFGEMGIQGFLGDLITLMEEDIMSLQVRPTCAVPHPAPIPTCGSVRRPPLLRHTNIALDSWLHLTKTSRQTFLAQIGRDHDQKKSRPVFATSGRLFLFFFSPPLILVTTTTKKEVIFHQANIYLFAIVTKGHFQEITHLVVTFLVTF